MNWQGALSGRFSLHGLTKAPGTITIPGNENTQLRRNSGRSTLDKRYDNPSNNWKIPVNPLSEAFKLYPTLSDKCQIYRTSFSNSSRNAHQSGYRGHASKQYQNINRSESQQR
ncbi:uncharacterized protein LOC122534666 [Frieseomelitta varia]|uniref:uncharacterized protein LOC122534666 n=1 Tax=Frieseomelitta varia TaxID=561572 RepID=UPI001CB6A8A6|nr:uncharacterized protein LOC122534666 [Frieseomelitta varia]